MGEDIIVMDQDFFTSGTFPAHLSETNIVLIPKKSANELMGDLRPIALCNVVYKVVSKVMANRIKMVLNMVISETQNVFVLGRGAHGSGFFGFGLIGFRFIGFQIGK